MPIARVSPASLRRAAGMGPAFWHDVLRAALELAVARARLGRSRTRDLLQAPPDTGPDLSLRAAAHDLLIVRRVAFAIPRVAARVPWRADCLVQALAAQRWLERRGIGSALSIGVSNNAAEGFLAHAWLKVGDELVTGGDISPYQPLGMPQNQPPL